MKFVSTARSAFMKAAGHPVMQAINENASKITGIAFTACDVLLTSINYLKTGAFKIDLPPSTPDQWLSASGLTWMAASGLFLAGDRFPSIKKPVGLLSCAGAAGIAMTVPDYGWGMCVTAAAPMLTGLSLLFEDQANRAAQSLSSFRNAFARAGQAYLEYPIATMAAIQTVSAGAALYQGVSDPEQRILIPYALMWMAGNGTFAMTDNNVRAAIRRIGSAPAGAVPA